MNWYLVKLIFQIIRGNGNHTPQFDEQLRLVRADEAAWAIEKAHVLGWLEQSDFESTEGEKIIWKFIEVADIQKLTNLEDGAHMQSTTVEPLCSKEYLHQVSLQATKAQALIRQEENLLPAEI